MRRNISDGSDSWNVHVHLGDPEVLTDSAGKYTSYQFKFQVGTELHILKARYSVLWKFNEKVQSSYYGPHANMMPKFPPKTWLRDMTKPKNYHKRAEELHAFIKELLQDAEFLKWQHFHDLLNLPPNLKKKMIEIADSMISKREILQSSLNGKPDPDWPGGSKSGKSDPVVVSKEVEKSKKEANKVQDAMLDKQLKEILRWAEESFMSAERNSMYEGAGGYDEEDENGDRQVRYAQKLSGVRSVPPFKPDKDFERRKKPNVEGFVSEIDQLLQNFETDLFPEIARPSATNE